MFTRFLSLFLLFIKAMRSLITCVYLLRFCLIWISHSIYYTIYIELLQIIYFINEVDMVWLTDSKLSNIDIICNSHANCKLNGGVYVYDVCMREMAKSSCWSRKHIIYYIFNRCIHTFIGTELSSKEKFLFCVCV